MLKNISKLQIKIDEKVYEFLCDNDSTLGSIYDAITQMKQYVLNLMIEQEKKQEKKCDQSCE